MHSPLTANDLLPLVARLDPQERKRLLTLLQQAGERDATMYRLTPVRAGEFDGEVDALEWEADGWEHLE